MIATAAATTVITATAPNASCRRSLMQNFARGTALDAATTGASAPDNASLMDRPQSFDGKPSFPHQKKRKRRAHAGARRNSCDAAPQLADTLTSFSTDLN